MGARRIDPLDHAGGAGEPTVRTRFTKSLLVSLVGVVAAGCSDSSQPSSEPTQTTSSSSSSPTPAEESPSASATPTDEPAPPPVRPDSFDAAQAMAVVRHLAGEIGPRHGTSAEFREAAGWVGGYFERLGYRVERQVFDVPGGNSWGVDVPAGESVNVIGTPAGFDPRRPHLVIGAHLDTVPQSPGAEDNGSGVGVLLAAAAAVADARTRLPVVWVAFGAEEPRGDGDDDHHYGSRAYVASLTAPERRAVRGMVSLDRVGVGETVPVGSAYASDPVQQALLDAARRTDTPATPDPFQQSSDHWSFVRAGLPGARLGSTPYPAYHSEADVPSVVNLDQLARTGRILLAWLTPDRP